MANLNISLIQTKIKEDLRVRIENMYNEHIPDLSFDNTKNTSNKCEETILMEIIHKLYN